VDNVVTQAKTAGGEERIQIIDQQDEKEVRKGTYHHKCDGNKN
jgi:hypothetical protein